MNQVSPMERAPELDCSRLGHRFVSVGGVRCQLLHNHMYPEQDSERDFQEIRPREAAEGVMPCGSQAVFGVWACVLQVVGRWNWGAAGLGDRWPSLSLFCPLAPLLENTPGSPSVPLPFITEGLQMARLSGSLPRKSVGFISPFSLPYPHMLALSFLDPILGLREEG